MIKFGKLPVFATVFGLVFLSTQAGRAQQVAGRTTLVVSQNPNGDGIRVVDQNSNNQLIDTANGRSLGEQEEANEDLVVAGLLEWFKNKKKKKKEENKLPLPLPLPIPYIKPERKEIHIHINNHIKKKEKHRHGKHKKHGGHYEDYHEGHYDHDYHDKHYHGKHSWPLLSHHYNWDSYGDHSAGGHDHSGGHDDYAGDESKRVLSMLSGSVASTTTSRAKMQTAALATKPLIGSNQQIRTNQGRS